MFTPAASKFDPLSHLLNCGFVLGGVAVQAKEKSKVIGLMK